MQDSLGPTRHAICAIVAASSSVGLANRGGVGHGLLEGVVWLAYLSRDAPGRRAARLTAASIVLWVLTLGFLVLAAVLGLSGEPVGTTASLPVPVEFRRPAISITFAALAAWGAVVVGLAAAQTTAAIRVLDRDRRLPPAVSAELRQQASRILGPAAVAHHQLDRDPKPPPSALPVPASPASVRVTVLMPAHNEELIIERSLASLWNQTRRPDRVVVVADNCTDATAEIADAAGAEVFFTEGNVEKKAGALNQALARLLPQVERTDVIMVMDADTLIVPGFLAAALGRLEQDPDLIAVGGVFNGEPGGGLIGQLQRNEFSRYQRYVSRRKGRVFVLTGTASVFRGYALAAVAEARGSLVPGRHDQVYDTLALTEDNELTLALKSLGARMVSPRECQVITEIMPNLRALWRQRSRWQRGALENIGAYGLTRTTARYWGQQLGIGYGTIALAAYLILILITFLAADGFESSWFWVLIACIFVVERVATVTVQGWRGVLLALPLVIELGYSVILQAVYVKSLVDIATRTKPGWNTVVREGSSQ